MRAVAVALVLAASSGCLRKTEFQCANTDQCGSSGMCIEGYCAFPDTTRCGPNGLVYDQSAGALAGQCAIGGDNPDAPVVDPDAPDGPPPTGCPAGYDMLPGGSAHLYKILTTAENWDTQRGACRATSQSAYLAVPDDLTELEAIDGIAGAATYWIGVSDPTEGQYIRDSDGMPQLFLPWAPGQPTGNMEDCVEAVAATHQFNDDRCMDKKRAVCECEP